MLTTASIAQIKDVSIYDVVSKSVKLKKAGSGYSGCCPFHNEKTASFSINTSRNTYKCFGCGAGGDPIAYVRAYYKLDFQEAAEWLADLGGISLERDRSFDHAAYEVKKAERKSLQQLMDECAARFVSNLWAPGSAGLAYLKDVRGYDDETIRYWQLGYAHEQDNALVKHYWSTGALPQLQRLSLITETKNGDDARHWDFFRGRVLFPISNERGEIVSYGGRIVGRDAAKGDPKYLNTATTDLYEKSKTLFGLYQAAKGIRDLKFATLTEGYTDVISLHKAGLTNTVASCGTALTPEQCAMLKRHTDRVLLMRDGDDAGRKATSRDLELLLSFGFAVDMLPMDAGKDPDDFSRLYWAIQELPLGEAVDG